MLLSSIHFRTAQFESVAKRHISVLDSKFHSSNIMRFNGTAESAFDSFPLRGNDISVKFDLRHSVICSGERQTDYGATFNLRHASTGQLSRQAVASEQSKMNEKQRKHFPIARNIAMLSTAKPSTLIISKRNDSTHFGRHQIKINRTKWTRSAHACAANTHHRHGRQLATHHTFYTEVEERQRGRESEKMREKMINFKY